MEITLKELVADKEMNPREYELSEVVANAEYILSVLRLNPVYMMSWGFQKPVATLYDEMMALRFSVNGFQHSGMVYVTYNDGADTFEVYLKNHEGKIVSNREDVYVDELSDVIDYMVEKGNLTHEEYSKKIGDTIFSF